MAATNDESQKRTLISILRSLCTSRKDSMSTMQEMFRDYKEAEGEDIPFRRFGYNSLEKMLTDSGEFTVSRNLSGAIQIRAKISEETQHITRMKAAEKTTSKKRGGGSSGGFKAAPRRLNTNFNSRQNQSAYTNNYSRMSSTPLRSMPKYNQTVNKPRVTYTQSSNTYSYGGNKGGANGFSKPAPSLNNNNYKYKSNYVPEDRSNLPTVTYVGGVDMRKPQVHQTSKPAAKPPSPVRQPEAPKPIEKPKPVEAPKPVERKALLTTPVQRSVSISSEPKTITVTTNAVKKVPVNSQMLAMPPAEYRPSPLQNVNVTTSSLNNRLIRHTRSYEDKLTVTFPNGDQTPTIAAPIVGRKSVQDRIKIQRVETAPQEVFAQPPPNPVQRQATQPSIYGTEWDIAGITNMEKLERYCLINKLVAPEYKCYRSKAKTYQGKVTVRDTSYSTYPMEYVTETEAYLEAAAVAVEQLKTEEYTTKYPVIMESNLEIALKLLECLKATSPHGRIRTHVPELFRQHYQLTLPDNWFKVVVLDYEEFFVVEKGSSEEIDLIFPKMVSSPSPTALVVPTVSLTPKLELPWKEPHWNLYVKNPVKTDEIWARLIGADYSEQFDSLMTDIEVSMMTDKTRPTSISEGDIGLVCVSECWSRVRIEKIRTDLMCQCFDIDQGDVEVYPIEVIYVCEPRFLELPAQAVMFSLFGLEDFAENPYSEPHLEKHLNSKVLIGEIISTQEDYDADFNSPHLQPRVKMVLYDTSSDDDINLNKLLLEQIGKDMAADEPKLDCLQTYNRVVVTHVEESGDIYCQQQDKASVMLYILKLIHNLVELNFESDEQYRGLYDDKSEDSKNNLYLVRDPIDSKWYRASYISPDAEKTSHKFFYVDYGITRAVIINDIYRLNLLSVALREFPGQAFKIRLFEIPSMTVPLLARLRGLLPQNQTALVKILSSSSNIPLVNLFIQSGPQHTLASVNEALRYEKAIEHLSDQAQDAPSVSRSAGKTSPSSLDGNPASSSGSPSLSVSPVNGALKQKLDLPRLVDCKLPPTNSFFNVYITVASNPSFFMVQSYDDLPKFNEMMSQLQTHCVNRKEYIPSDMIEVGQAYAGFHVKHNVWYRVIVQAIYGTSMIHVKFCDIGEVDVLANDQLKTLPNSLRILPKQALRAKLYGVTPKHIDWTMEDAVRFRELIINKRFVSVIKAVREDEICANELCASMQLIDVSGDDDVYLNKVLIDEDRAKPFLDDIMLNSE